MTTAELISRLRAMLDEPSAVNWTDGELYDFLDSGQNKVISLLLAKGRQGKEVHPSLKPLLKYIAVNTATAPTLATGITDLKEWVYAELYYGSSGTNNPLTKLEIDELRARANNQYLADMTIDSTTKAGDYTYAVVGSTIYWGFPVTSDILPTKWDKVNIYYLYTPNIIASGVEPTLNSETHEAILHFAVSLAQIKNNDLQQAQLNEQIANNLITNL